MHNWYIFYEDGYIADVRYARKIVLLETEEENCFLGWKFLIISFVYTGQKNFLY